MNKQLIWMGAILGSTLGGFIPSLWHAGWISLWGAVCSTIGGVAGIWAAWKIGQLYF